MPMEWIDRVFELMISFFGNRFADMWQGTDIDAVKAIWASQLGDLSPDEIRIGISAMKRGRGFPPTLPEFIALCRPPLNYERLFILASRAAGGAVSWENDKLAYWSAYAFGMFELRNATWRTAEKRWTRIVDEMLEDKLPEIPPPRPALPMPGQTHVPRPEHERRMAEVMARLRKKKSDPKAWARKILANPSRYPMISKDFAERALRKEVIDVEPEIEF